VGVVVSTLTDPSSQALLTARASVRIHGVQEQSLFA
jgi:hypothetical protein